MSSSSLPTFPIATQPQIVRANQKDIYYISYLREQLEVVLRSFLGTRWLSRWDKEVELLSRLLYFGLTVGRGSQTFGEEYVDIWQLVGSSRRPSATLRITFILLSTLPSYIINRFASRSASQNPIGSILNSFPTILETLSEINLAAFYLSGKYYDLMKRTLGIRYISLIKPDPHTRPPSYSLLGVLLVIRILYRFWVYLRTLNPKSIDHQDPSGATPGSSKEIYIDSQHISSLVGVKPGDDVRPEIDEHTILDLTVLTEEQRTARRCTLCLEERTGSCSTECGHAFCWTCIVGWGREKAECPLCRQSLNLNRLLPLYNL